MKLINILEEDKNLLNSLQEAFNSCVNGETKKFEEIKSYHRVVKSQLVKLYFELLTNWTNEKKIWFDNSELESVFQKQAGLFFAVFLDQNFPGHFYLINALFSTFRYNSEKTFFFDHLNSTLSSNENYFLRFCVRSFKIESEEVENVVTYYYRRPLQVQSILEKKQDYSELIRWKTTLGRVYSELNTLAKLIKVLLSEIKNTLHSDEFRKRLLSKIEDFVKNDRNTMSQFKIEDLDFISDYMFYELNAEEILVDLLKRVDSMIEEINCNEYSWVGSQFNAILLFVFFLMTNESFQSSFHLVDQNFSSGNKTLDQLRKCWNRLTKANYALNKLFYSGSEFQKNMHSSLLHPLVFPSCCTHTNEETIEYMKVQCTRVNANLDLSIMFQVCVHWLFSLIVCEMARLNDNEMIKETMQTMKTVESSVEHYALKHSFSMSVTNMNKQLINSPAEPKTSSKLFFEKEKLFVLFGEEWSDKNNTENQNFIKSHSTLGYDMIIVKHEEEWEKIKWQMFYFVFVVRCTSIHTLKLIKKLVCFTPFHMLYLIQGKVFFFDGSKKVPVFEHVDEESTFNLEDEQISQLCKEYEQSSIDLFASSIFSQDEQIEETEPDEIVSTIKCLTWHYFLSELGAFSMYHAVKTKLKCLRESYVSQRTFLFDSDDVHNIVIKDKKISMCFYPTAFTESFLIHNLSLKKTKLKQLCQSFIGKAFLLNRNITFNGQRMFSSNITKPLISCEEDLSICDFVTQKFSAFLFSWSFGCTHTSFETHQDYETFLSFPQCSSNERLHVEFKKLNRILKDTHCQRMVNEPNLFFDEQAVRNEFSAFLPLMSFTNAVIFNERIDPLIKKNAANKQSFSLDLLTRTVVEYDQTEINTLSDCLYKVDVSPSTQLLLMSEMATDFHLLLLYYLFKDQLDKIDENSKEKLCGLLCQYLVSKNFEHTQLSNRIRDNFTSIDTIAVITKILMGAFSERKLEVNNKSDAEQYDYESGLSDLIKIAENTKNSNGNIEFVHYILPFGHAPWEYNGYFSDGIKIRQTDPSNIFDTKNDTHVVLLLETDECFKQMYHFLSLLRKIITNFYQFVTKINKVCELHVNEYFTQCTDIECTSFKAKKYPFFFRCLDEEGSETYFFPSNDNEILFDDQNFYIPISFASGTPENLEDAFKIFLEQAETSANELGENQKKQLIQGDDENEIPQSPSNLFSHFFDQSSFVWQQHDLSQLQDVNPEPFALFDYIDVAQLPSLETAEGSSLFFTEEITWNNVDQREESFVEEQRKHFAACAAFIYAFFSQKPEKNETAFNEIKEVSLMLLTMYVESLKRIEKTNFNMEALYFDYDENNSKCAPFALIIEELSIGFLIVTQPFLSKFEERILNTVQTKNVFLFQTFVYPGKYCEVKFYDPTKTGDIVIKHLKFDGRTFKRLYSKKDRNKTVTINQSPSFWGSMTNGMAQMDTNRFVDQLYINMVEHEFRIFDSGGICSFENNRVRRFHTNPQRIVHLKQRKRLFDILLAYWQTEYRLNRLIPFPFFCENPKLKEFEFQNIRDLFILKKNSEQLSYFDNLTRNRNEHGSKESIWKTVTVINTNLVKPRSRKTNIDKFERWEVTCFVYCFFYFLHFFAN